MEYSKRPLVIDDYVTCRDANCTTPEPPCNREAIFYWPMSYGPLCTPCSIIYLTEGIEKLKREIIGLKTSRHMYSPDPKSLEVWIENFTRFIEIIKDPSEVSRLEEVLERKKERTRVLDSFKR